MKSIVDDARIIANGKLSWDKLKGKTVLIAGANGYVPQFFVHGFLMRNDLYDNGIKVIALCRSEKRAFERFADYIGRSDFELIISDVLNFTEYNGQIDYIIHAASPASIKTRYNNYLSIFETNVLGARNLLELAAKNKATFLYISSVDIYGKVNEPKRLCEDYSGSLNTLDLRNTYSCAKRATETLCMCYSEKGVASKIVRPFQIIGPGIELDDGRLHADFLNQILNNGKIILKGDGTPTRTFLYITDAILGILTVMLDGNVGEAYNVVSEMNEASVLELAKLMASLAKKEGVSIEFNMETRKTDPSVTKVISYVCGDSSKISKLGWKAEVSLKEACQKLMDYYGA